MLKGMSRQNGYHYVIFFGCIQAQNFGIAHVGTIGNEKANELAKTGASNSIVTYAHLKIFLHPTSSWWRKSRREHADSGRTVGWRNEIRMGLQAIDNPRFSSLNPTNQNAVSSESRIKWPHSGSSNSSLDTPSWDDTTPLFNVMETNHNHHADYASKERKPHTISSTTVMPLLARGWWSVATISCTTTPRAMRWSGMEGSSRPSFSSLVSPHFSWMQIIRGRGVGGRGGDKRPSARGGDGFWSLRRGGRKFCQGGIGEGKRQNFLLAAEKGQKYAIFLLVSEKKSDFWLPLAASGGVHQYIKSFPRGGSGFWTVGCSWVAKPCSCCI